ncbi:hypothetical protein [Kitasatospora sp. NPDC002040]|uniref:hypothetical protein n=1 Tax=Kitasatospora sp. NPDC002040 TaxID=3154661 RepID=UPI00332A6953
MSTGTLTRPITRAVPIAFRGPAPEVEAEANAVLWRPVVGDLVADIRGDTPLRAPLLVVEVGLYSCSLELWSGSECRPLVRSLEDIQPYQHNDRELFGYPTQTKGGPVGEVRQYGHADVGCLPLAA